MFFDATIGKKNHTIFKIHVSNIFPTDWAENSRSARVVSKTKHSKTTTEARSTQISKTKHPKLENGAPKTRKRSTQISKPLYVEGQGGATHTLDRVAYV